jgi:DNA-binding Lrp family transcriptional regulator
VKEFLVLDELDRRVVHALQLDARASFERIGAVLGVSDQTVARRYRRLVDHGAVAIRAVHMPIDGTAQGWFVRLRCAPPQTRSIAGQLSARDDTRWVMLTSGGTEIVFLLHVEGHRTAPSVRDALLAALHATPGILGIEAYSPLRFFVGHQVAWQARMSALAPAEVDAFSGAAPATPRVRHDQVTDDLDRAIMDVLTDDGRAPIARVALSVGASESSVRRHLDRLVARSIIYFDVVIDERLLGYQELTLIWLQVPLNQLDDLGRRVATHAPVAMVTAMSGNYDLLIAAASRNRDELYDYLTGELAQTIGSAPFRTSPVLELVKRG